MLSLRRIKVRHDQANLPGGQCALAVMIARLEQVSQQLFALADPPFELLAGRLGLAEGEILRPQLLEAVASDLEICVGHKPLCLLLQLYKGNVFIAHVKHGGTNEENAVRKNKCLCAKIVVRKLA